MFLQRLGGRVRELVAFLASMLSRLLLSTGHAGLHVRVDIVTVLKEVVDDIVLDGPGKEVQLAYGGGDPVEVHTGPTAEGVEHLLAVGLQMGLVGEVDDDVFPGLGNVGHVVHLGVIGDKPVEDPEGDVGLVLQDIAEESQAFGSIKRFKTVEDPIFLRRDFRCGRHYLSAGFSCKSDYTYTM